MVVGPALRNWLETRYAEVLSASQIDNAWAAMDSQIVRRDPVESERHPIPTSLTEWATQGFTAVVSACLALTIFGQLLEKSTHWLITEMASLLLVSLAILLYRNTSSRLLMWSASAWGTTSFLLAASLAGMVLVT